MSGAEARLKEDKALRDAALAIFNADLANLKSDVKTRGVGERISDRIGETAADMLDEAVDMAGENKGILGALGVAIALWFGRIPILVALGFDEAEDDDAEPDDRLDHSSDDDEFYGEEDDD